MTLQKKALSIVMAFLLILLTVLPAAAAEEEQTIDEVRFSIDAPVCGRIPDVPEVWPNEEYILVGAEPCLWVMYINETDPWASVPYMGMFIGGEPYKALITFEPAEGYRFDEEAKAFILDSETWEYVPCEIIQQDAGRMTVLCEVRAEHDWETEEYTEATCVSEGKRTERCLADPSHTRSEVLPPDPEAHEWGEWEIVREATKAEEGEKTRSCTMCGETQTETVPRVTLPYTKVYEPETSWAMAATVAWQADGTAVETASADRRPATAFVRLDRDLKVYDRDGELLAESVGEYVDATSCGVIPAFRIDDAETAAALKAWLPSYGLQDCFVVSTPENSALVKDVADLLHVRGMLDYTAVTAPAREELVDMVAAVNGAHGKVILLAQEAATRENVRLLQSLASTVWVQTDTDTKSLVTMYANGVNGVLVDDYEAAIRAEELFRDDAPTLLRLPLIIGHRGDPSVYVENTLDSAKGAFEEGADSVENDIQLSADGELFILHDDSPRRLVGITDTDEDGMDIRAESLTLAELRAHPFRWDSIIEANEVPAESTRDGTLYGQDEQKEYVVPTLREYIEEFKGTGLIHDTEIKSYDPAILPVLKALINEYDAWDQIFCITFNRDILDAIYAEYPEISIGVLGMAMKGTWMSTMAELDAYQEITDEEGPEAALAALCRDIDRWNGTYNPFYYQYGEEMVRAGRHRGLTVWPWTYIPGEAFAHDYLSGVTGMTTDYAWDTSDYLVEISAEDVTAPMAEDIPRPQGTTRAGEMRTLEDAEPVLLEELSDTETLMIWRYRAEMVSGGESYGSYYLYSAPFVFHAGQAEEKDAGTQEPSTPAGEPVEQEEPGSGRGWALLAAAGALAVCGGAGGVFARRRSRRR